MRAGLLTSFGGSVIITILSVLFRGSICALFGSDAATTEYVVQIYPAFSLGFIVMAINVMLSAYLYSTERSALSTGISLLRSVALRSCTNSRRAHLDGKFSASLCQKTLKYI